MAKRPIFMPTQEGSLLVKTASVSFEWFSGFSISQKQRSIDALHAEACKIFGVERILEVSSKSKDSLGSKLSAFHLTLKVPMHMREFSVESAFQGSKVFERGGPYCDIYDMSSIEAKRDPRIRESGRLIGFCFFGKDWPTEPHTAFYDWLYLSALKQHPDLAARVLEFSAFTDIEFNPDKSVNCQAHSVALYVSLHNRGMLDVSMRNMLSFVGCLSGRPVSNARQDDTVQQSLF